MKRIALGGTLAAAALLALAGCTLEPAYLRPAAPVPERLGAAAGPALDASAVPDWQAVFLEPRLRQVIALALRNNRDLRVAVLGVEQARARYRIQRAALLPDVDASAGMQRERLSRSDSDSGQSEISRGYTAQVGTSSWELDLFGRVRSLKHEALESWLASAENQREVRLSLVAEVAGDWLALAADQQSLALARQTLESQQQSLARIEHRHAAGAADAQDVAQAQASVEQARADLAGDQTQLAQDRDALQLAVGAPLDDALLPADTSDDAGIALAPLPAPLPSSVLLQRPDVLAAEHALKAANADIGAARAEFFPTLTLTAATGRSSDSLSSLFSAGTRTWSFAPSLSVPIFHAGALKASLDASRIGKDIAVAQYERAIQSAFSETADALAARDHLGERLAAQQALVAASRRNGELADARYRAGLDGHLAVLDAQRTLYAAEQGLIALRASEALNRVTLYKVLGGGADAAP